MALLALGVVFGDIGTSPLYAVNEIFFSHSQIPLQSENIIGCISLILWAVTLLISTKYLFFVLRADNDGQGGVFSLYSLLHPFKKSGSRILLFMLILGAGLIFGDGIITPAISVLSAVEGLNVAAPFLSQYIVPITIGILAGLFFIQRHGTKKVGAIFGPIILIWFISLGVLGARQLLLAPEILAALNPIHGVLFLINSSFTTKLLVLGGVILSISGGEALYADMGHFGIKPIRRSWFAVVYPALILNYLGQGAYLLSGQTVLNQNIFYSMVPESLMIAMIILATAATIIASQALISGAFSLASQAMALGLLPRHKIIHTHQHHEGQIYSPIINLLLFVGTVALVVSFQSSTNLASAYGLAVSCDMLFTSISMFEIARLLWRWPLHRIYFIFGSFAIIDLILMVAGSHKLIEGGYIPLGIGLFLFGVMTTWRWGRKATGEAYSSVKSMTIRELVELKRASANLLDRNVILLVPHPIFSDEENAPALLQLFWDRYQILPRNLIFLEVIQKKTPYIHGDRYEIRHFQKDGQKDGSKGSVTSVTLLFGFMEDPNVEKQLESLANHHEINLSSNPKDWLVHASVENILPAKRISLRREWRVKVFSVFRQLSRPGYYYYGLGDEVQLSLEILPVRLK